jgi:hypothetical protein
LQGGIPVGEPWCGHNGGVDIVAVAELEDRPVMISGGEDGTLQVRQLDGGALVCEPWRGHDGGVRAVAIGEVGRRQVIISGGFDGPALTATMASNDPRAAHPPVA